MDAYIYDKTFEGLLCVVFDAYTRKEFPTIVAQEGDILPLHITNTHTVQTQAAHADRVYAGLRKKLSGAALHNLMYTWLSEQPMCDTLLFRYICKVFDAEGSIEMNCTDADVLAVLQLSKQVRNESHLMLGFVRFQKTSEGVYFAAISPRYNVISLIVPHFVDRFADQQWILYDAGRKLGYYYDTHTVHDAFIEDSFMSEGKLDSTLLAHDELFFQSLWKSYFSAIAIKERHNPTLQRRMVAPRFWQYMTEFQK